MNTFFKKGAGISADEHIAYLAALSVFLPYYLSIGIISLAAFYVLIKSDTRRAAFNTPGSYVVLTFAVYSSAVALYSRNYLGFLAALVFFVILILGHYIRAVMSRELFEKVLDICCFASLFASFIAITEKLMHFHDKWYRCCGDLFGNTSISFYGHPNYLGALMAAVIIICAYKIVALQSKKMYYYLIAVLSAVIILLTESMFAWIEVFVGLTVLLIVTRRYKLLLILFGLTALAASVLYVAPKLFPRTAHIGSSFNSRAIIWDLSLKAIKDNVWFGKGFFAYYEVSKAVPGAYIAKHSHNIVLDFMLCFGIIGSVIIFILVFIFFQRLVMCKNFLKSGTAVYLILSVICAMLMHSILDMTMIWIQTAMLYLLIFSGLGAEENVMHNLLSNKKQTDKTQGD